MPKVSIVLLAFENKNDIKKTFDCILSQTFEDWELIVVDDGSSFDVSKAIDELKRKDDRIKVLKEKNNFNFSSRLNKAFLNAKGEYFTWLLPKTFYKKNALQVMVEFLEKNEDFDLVTSRYDKIKEDGKKIASFKKEGALGLLEENNIAPCFLYTKKIAKAIGGLDKNLFEFQDYDFFFRVALNGKIKYLKENLSISIVEKISKEKEELNKKRILKIKEKYVLNLFLKLDYTRKKQIQILMNLYLKNKSEKIWLKKAMDIDHELFLRSVLLNFFRLFDLFSFKKEKNNLLFKFLSFRLRLKLPFDKKLYKAFKNKKIEPKTILILEYNDCHFETILGLMKYCLDLGFQVDILTRENAEHIFDDISFEGVRIFEANKKTFDKILKTFDFSSYERIIFNSKAIYKGKNGNSFDISKILNKIPKGKKENIYLQHHLEYLKDYPKEKQVILANPSKSPLLEDKVVNCNYFKKTKIKSKNEVVNFISVGELSKKRRNFSLLVDSIFELHKKGYENFKVTVIGRGEEKEIPFEIRRYFDILGRIDYKSMFEEIENADFILPLLDPNLEAHKRYLAFGASGSFQLSYGFLKPLILNKTFAKAYDFKDENSIIYEKNEDLASSLEKALLMDSEAYFSLIENLKIKKEKIEEKSLKNLSAILKN